MEIADLFVINKADRPGVEKAQHEIESIGVPVYRTVATEGSGIGELADALAGWTRQKAIPSLEWAIDHLGIAVKSLEEALPFYQAQLGMPVAGIETVEHEGVRVAMIRAGASNIELLEALDDDSVIATFIAKRGPGLHHVAMRVNDLNGVIARLRAAGVRLLGEPRQGAGGHTYVFVHPGSAGGVLWELIRH
jgi:methylmalonyl-CoA epimerase